MTGGDAEYCPTCGDNVCDEEGGETCRWCDQDCGLCPPTDSPTPAPIWDFGAGPEPTPSPAPVALPEGAIREVGDASNELLDAQELEELQNLIPGTSLVFGSIDSRDEGDLFQISLSEPGKLALMVQKLNGQLDTNLFIFDGEGYPIESSDDYNTSPTGCSELAYPTFDLDSCLVLNLDQGVYYVGVGGYLTVA